MDIDQSQTVLLFFTRSADEEARAKRFTRSDSFAKNRSVAQRLISHSYKQIHSSGLQAVRYSSDKQQGDSFGERLANAFGTLFAEGYENIIAIGNDCIQLSGETIRRAAKLLKHTPAVIGPATDGGAYLIGMNRKVFNREAFRSLSWKTNRLLGDLIGYARKNSPSLELLEELRDIDFVSDLEASLQEIKKRTLYSRLAASIHSILQSLIPSSTGQHVTSFLILFPEVGLSHRGPPVQ